MLATRVDANQAAELTALFPAASYNSIGRTLRIEVDQPDGQPVVRQGKVVDQLIGAVPKAKIKEKLDALA